MAEIYLGGILFSRHISPPGPGSAFGPGSSETVAVAALLTAVGMAATFPLPWLSRGARRAVASLVVIGALAVAIAAVPALASGGGARGGAGLLLAMGALSMSVLAGHIPRAQAQQGGRQGHRWARPQEKP